MHAHMYAHAQLTYLNAYNTYTYIYTHSGAHIHTCKRCDKRIRLNDVLLKVEEGILSQPMQKLLGAR